MKTGRGGAIRRDLGRLFEGQSVSGLGESQLLERFVERRDEPAFAALVARHGPMVLGVCRRLLADPFDVEDAFQATFLVLVRRAGSLRDRDRLAPWLFGVARRVATRARTDLARRKARERPGAEDFAAIPVLDDQGRELGRALVEEIDRLPGPLRDPILLCCVEGLTYEEAAGRLQSTAPAVRGRLARARDRLRDRLARRGFAPTAPALGALLWTGAAPAAVPASLLKTTIQASTAGTVPAGVEALAEGVIRTMILTKSKILAAAVVAVGIAGSSLGVSAQQGPNQGQGPAEADRLGQVEQKLDRVLQALERSNRTGNAAPALLPPAAPAAPAAPPAPPAPGGMMGGMMGHPGMMGMGMPAPAGLPPNPSRTANRLEAVERKVEALEARIANLERRLGSDQPSEDEPVGNNPFRDPRRRTTQPRSASPRAEPVAPEKK